MGTAPQALLLTTIATDANGWHVGRFSLLGTMLRTAGEEMDPSFNLTISDDPTSDAERQSLQGDLSSGGNGQI